MVIKTFEPWMKLLNINYGFCHLHDLHVEVFRRPSTEYVSRWKCSKATQKSFLGCKRPLSGTVSTTDLQDHVSAGPSEHVINWRSRLLSLRVMARVQNFSSAHVCIVIRNIFYWRCDTAFPTEDGGKIRITHNECRAARCQCCRRDCLRSLQCLNSSRNT